MLNIKYHTEQTKTGYVPNVNSRLNNKYLPTLNLNIG